MRAVESPKICTLIGSFCPKHIKIQTKKYGRVIVSWYWGVMQSLKKNRLLVPKKTWGICWIFTQTLKSTKISLRCALFVQRIWGLSLRNTEGWHWRVMQNLHKPTMWSQKRHEELGELSLEDSKSEKVFIEGDLFLKSI